LSAPQEEVGARLGRRKKWSGDAVIMTIYIPLDLKKVLEARAAARRKSLSEYAVSLILKGLEDEKGTEAERNAEAKEVP
jgi:ABC-type molybdate transport system permease subunit